MSLDEWLQRNDNGRRNAAVRSKKNSDNTSDQFAKNELPSSSSSSVTLETVMNYDSQDWSDLMPLPRRKRKVRTHNRATATTSAGQTVRSCGVTSRSEDSRFKQKILGEKNAIPVMSLCSVDELVQEFERTNGNTDRLERAVTELAKQMQRKDCYTHIELTYRQIMASVLQSSTFLERMKKDSQSLFTPDVWTFSMVHFNAYEEGVRYEDLFFRSCSNTNCLSTYIRGEQSFRMCECLNADAVKKILISDKSALKHAKSFGRHRCLLCIIQDIYSFCMNPLSDHPVTAETFAADFSFEFEGLKPEFEIQCQMTTTNGVNINYKCLNIDAAFAHLTWKFDIANKLHYVDFSHLFLHHQK